MNFTTNISNKYEGLLAVDGGRDDFLIPFTATKGL